MTSAVFIKNMFLLYVVCVFVSISVCVAESLCTVSQWRETRESHHNRDSGAGSE